MKTAITFILLSLASIAFADVYETTVQCKRSAKSTCAERTVQAFEKLGCQPVADSVHCQDAATDPNLDPEYKDKVKGHDFCDIQSICHEPNYGNFGQVSCNYGKTGERKVDLRKASFGITLTTSVGLMQRMVSTLCK